MEAANQQTFLHAPPQADTVPVEAARKALRERNDVRPSAKVAWEWLLDRAEGKFGVAFQFEPNALGKSVGAKDALKTGKDMVTDLEIIGAITTTKLKRGLREGVLHPHSMWKVEGSLELTGTPAEDQGRLPFEPEPPIGVAVLNPDEHPDKNPDEHPDLSHMSCPVEGDAQIGMSHVDVHVQGDRDPDAHPDKNPDGNPDGCQAIVGSPDVMRRFAEAKIASDATATEHEIPTIKDGLLEFFARCKISNDRTITAYVEKIFAIVKEPNLNRAFVIKVASGILDDTKLEADLLDLLGYIRTQFGEAPEKQADRGRMFWKIGIFGRSLDGAGARGMIREVSDANRRA